MCVPLLDLLGIRDLVRSLLSSAVSVAAPPTSPFMALLMDPVALKAQAFLAALQFGASLFPRESSPVCCCQRNRPMRSFRSPAYHIRRRRYSSSFLSQPLGDLSAPIDRHKFAED